MLKTLSTRRVAGALIAGCVALAAGAVFADAPHFRQGHVAGPHTNMGRIFSEMDTNHDGRISRAEAEAFMKARAAEIDTNKDGKISLAEFKAFLQKQRDKRLAARLARFDENGDGTVTVQEFENAGMWRIARFSRHGDDHGRRMYHRYMAPPRN